MEHPASRQLEDESPGSDRERSAVLRFFAKVGVGALGGTVTVAGLIMLVTPGPGIPVTVLGLMILGREFPAARRQLRKIKQAGQVIRRR